MYERIDCSKMKTVQLSHANIDFFTGNILKPQKIPLIALFALLLHWKVRFEDSNTAGLTL